MMNDVSEDLYVMASRVNLESAQTSMVKNQSSLLLVIRMMSDLLSSQESYGLQIISIPPTITQKTVKDRPQVEGEGPGSLRPDIGESVLERKGYDFGVAGVGVVGGAGGTGGLGVELRRWSWYILTLFYSCP